MSIPELKFIVPDEIIFLILIEPIMKNPIRRVSRNWSRGGHFSKFSTRVGKMSISIS